MQKRTMKRIPILGLALVCSALVLGCFDDDDDETAGGNGDGDGDATYTRSIGWASPP